jgi:RHS repeat-associated protein
MREMTNTGGVTNTLREAFLHTDHLGSNSITTNASGAVLARQSYMPFGSVRSGGTGSMPTDIGFTGQRLDAGTGGLMYYGARYYLPGLSRFASADTIVPGAGNPQALNRFSYALNNPIKYTDPSGHCVVICTAIIGAAIGGIVGAIGYTAYTATTGQAFDYGEYFTAVGNTALAGAYIGSGIGMIQAAASATALTVAAVASANVPIGIGVGIGSAEVGYAISTASTGEDFNVQDFTVSTAAGAISGGIDAALPGSSNLGYRLAGQTVLGAAQYAVTDGFDPGGMAEATIASLTLAGASEVMGAFGGKSILDTFDAVGSANLTKTVSPIVVGEQLGNAALNVGRSAYLAYLSARAEEMSPD